MKMPFIIEKYVPSIDSNSAAKAKINEFPKKSLAPEVTHKGITVNIIIPKLIYTPVIQMIDTVATEHHKSIPAKRLGNRKTLQRLQHS